MSIHRFSCGAGGENPNETFGKALDVGFYSQISIASNLSWQWIQVKRYQQLNVPITASRALFAVPLDGKGAAGGGS